MKTSNAQRPDADSAQTGGTFSDWRTLGRLFRRRPGLMGTVSLFVLAGISTLLGLSVQTAWVSLIIGLVVFAMVVHWMDWFRRTAGTQEGGEVRKSVFSEYAGCLYIIIIFCIGSWLTGKPLLPVGRQGGQVPQVIVKQSKVYWDLTVASLHQARFGLPTPKQGESLEAYDRRRSEMLASALGKARNISSENVDPELVKMVESHFRIDDQALQLFEHSIQIANARTTTSSDASAQGLIPDLSSFTTNLTEDDLSKMPPDFREMIRDGWKLEETRLDQLREIEIMQARLNERYKSQGWESRTQLNKTRRFELPKIRTID